MKRNNFICVKIILYLCFFPLSLKAQSNFSQKINAIFQKSGIDAKQAALFGTTPVLSPGGRLEPMNTFSSEALRKLHHSDKINGYDSDYFLLSLRQDPESWTDVNFIHFSNKEIACRYGLSLKYCAYNELFDSDGKYKLQNDLDMIYSLSPLERTRLDKDLVKLDEQIHIFRQLANRTMPRIYSKNDGLMLDKQKINVELLYNRLNIFRLCRLIYLISSGLLLFFSLIALFLDKKGIWMSIHLLKIIITIAAFYHLFGIGMRWYIAGYAPWSNAYETMVYVAFVTVSTGILFARRSAITLALATLFSGIILFVSGLNWMDPQIGLLVPVLQSPWLMFHVAVIVAAYGFFGISFLLGIVNLLLFVVKKRNHSAIFHLHYQKLSLVNEISVGAGLALMTIGTFLGAIWANETWGRYWGWDPKETWALITILVYTITTHLRFMKKNDSLFFFNLMSIIAFFCVLMTYFGVNYFLTGMHSYGSR